jgi:hypothetical protein
MESFVTLAELEAFWKDVGDTNEKRAEILLKLASNRLRLIGEGSDIDLDAEIAASPVYEANVQWVVMEAVKRAMLPANRWSVFRELQIHQPEWRPLV